MIDRLALTALGAVIGVLILIQPGIGVALLVLWAVYKLLRANLP